MVSNLNLRKLVFICLIIILILPSGIAIFQEKQIRTTEFPMKKYLHPNDEGSHFHRLLPMREWWYFNIIFDKPDTELRNWSAMISFNHMSKSFDKPDILFVTLYDDANNTYGGMINEQSGTLQSSSPGVNISFLQSWVHGIYPHWTLHIEDKTADENHTIVMDLSFNTQCLPYWVGFNTGRGNPLSLMGYYSINHCDVQGKILFDNNSYAINGTGYFDHFWLPFCIGGASFFWDWFSVHLDNGLHAFIWQIISHDIGVPQGRRPGFCWITDGKNFTNFQFFMMNYQEKNPRS